MRRVTLVGSVLDFALGVAKLAGGWLSGSSALIADGFHSLSDLATDVMVLVAAKHAHAEADEDHPYGHGRIETVTTVALGASLVLIALGIAWDAIMDLLDGGGAEPPRAWALWIAAASVVAKEAMYHYTMHHARRLHSALLRANAWHTRSDAASSLVVIAGVGGALAGIGFLDAVAAVIVAVMVGHIGFDVARKAVDELIDTGLDAERLDDFRSAILSIDGVADLHQLRTRQMAGRAFVDVHIQLEDPRLSVSEGHQISETVRALLIREMEEVEDVMVHIDPEDDEGTGVLTRHLPLRGPVLERLERCWDQVAHVDRIQRVTLHYYNGRLHVDVEMPLALAPDVERIAAGLNDAVADEGDIAEVRVLLA